jgi:hypothetical protein
VAENEKPPSEDQMQVCKPLSIHPTPLNPKTKMSKTRKGEMVAGIVLTPYFQHAIFCQSFSQAPVKSIILQNANFFMQSTVNATLDGTK